MKHEEEIREIRNIINEIESNCFARTLQDNELKEGVTYLHTKDTGLSKDIIVDCGETYKYYNHPLCIYIVDGNNVIPVTISNFPETIREYHIPQDILSFIIDNQILLTQFANMEIDGGDFFNSIDINKREHRLVVEMSNYGPDKTGLPIWVYVDDTNSYLNSGHNGSYRMKFQQDKEVKNPRLWMPIILPSLVIKVDNVPPCKEPKKNVNLVLQWAEGNMDLLLKLRDGIITGAEFKMQMKKMDEIKVITDSECGM